MLNHYLTQLTISWPRPTPGNPLFSSLLDCDCNRFESGRLGSGSRSQLGCESAFLPSDRTVTSSQGVQSPPQRKELMVTQMPLIFRPRRLSHRRKSHKPATARTRERELRREGLSAGMMKLNGRWRVRRYRAREKLKSSVVYKEIEKIVPDLCQGYLAEVDKHLNVLRDEEIQQITLYWNSSSLRHMRFSSKVCSFYSPLIYVLGRIESITQGNHMSVLDMGFANRISFLLKKFPKTNLIFNMPNILFIPVHSRLKIHST